MGICRIFAGSMQKLLPSSTLVEGDLGVIREEEMQTADKILKSLCSDNVFELAEKDLSNPPNPLPIEKVL